MLPSEWLGFTATDKVTRFKGTVTGFATYLTGCNQILLVGKSVGGKAAEAAWFDEQRVVRGFTTKRAKVDNTQGNGADLPAPIK